MGTVSWEEWASLFTESVNNSWSNQRKELRKITMLFCAFQEEFLRIKKLANLQLHELKGQFELIDNYKQGLLKHKKCSEQKPSDKQTPKFFEFKESFPKLKENIDPDQTKIIHITDENKELKSPNIFETETDHSDHDDFNFFKNRPLQEKLITSDEHLKCKSMNITQSPKLRSSTDSPPTSPTNATSPKINKTVRFQNLRRPKVRSINTSLNMGTNLLPLNRPKGEVNFLQTPNYKTGKQKVGQLSGDREVNILESSVIDGTPELSTILRKEKKTKSIGKRRHPSSKHKTQKKTVKNATLTQILGVTPLEQSCVKNSLGQSPSENTLKEEPTLIKDDPLHCVSSMELSDIIHQINQPLERAAYASFLADYDRVPENKPPSPKYAYQGETVKGRNRLNLKGWACAECKKYYEALKLPEDQLREKINKCSRHRSKFQPVNDTPAGYWDLTFPPTQ